MELYKHQIEALNSTKNLNNVAYYYDMGLGKSFIGSEKLKELNAPISLIVCQKSKVNDWVEHMKTHYDFDVYDLTKKKEYKKFISSSAAVGVINYDLVFRRDELLELKDITLLLDESSMIKNHKAQRTKGVISLNHKNVILLSGTPVGGKYEELVTQCNLLGWNIKENDFWDRYVNYRIINIAPYVDIKKAYSYKNIDELKNNLYHYGARFLKTDEVMDMPEQVFNFITSDTTVNYDLFMVNDYVEVDGKEYKAVNPLTKLTYARQLVAPSKIQSFMDIINGTNDRVIVFYNFNYELDLLVKAIGKERPISIVNGETYDLNAYNNDSNSITLLQYQAGAMGLNMQKANYMILFSPTQSCELYMQCLKRIHRIGQKRSCFYYMLQAGIDIKIYETLKKGEDYTLRLFNNGK